MDKVNIGVKIDRSIWFEFRGRAFKEWTTAGELLEELIRDYLNKKSSKQVTEPRQRIRVVPEPVVEEPVEETEENLKEVKHSRFRGR